MAGLVWAGRLAAGEMRLEENRLGACCPLVACCGNWTEPAGAGLLPACC